MKNQTVAEKLDALVRLQKVDSALDSVKKLRGDLPEEVRNIEDSIEGLKVRLARFSNEQKELEEGIQKSKEIIKTAKELVKKYDKQQKNVKNSREYNAITKELELQELEVQIQEKKIKEAEERIGLKKSESEEAEKQLATRLEELEMKKTGLEKLLKESESEEKTLLTEREEAVKNVEERLLNYYNRLRRTLSNGLAVVSVVRGAPQGGNIVIPPQKIAEIRERKKIVIDEHSGRILAYVDTESIAVDKEKRIKAAEGETPQVASPRKRRLASTK